MELLGRDPQLAAATRAIGDVRRGAGRVLGLMGETGLGKSALLAEIGERARAAGLPVVAGRGSEHERDVPFGVIVDALGAVAGAPGEVPSRSASCATAPSRRGWRSAARSRSCSTTCTGPTRRRSSSCCTCCGGPSRFPRCW